MQRALNREDISIVVKKCSGYKEAAKQFINAKDDGESYLYVDLDRKPELRNEWFKSLSDDGIDMPSSDRSCEFLDSGDGGLVPETARSD